MNLTPEQLTEAFRRFPGLEAYMKRYHIVISDYGYELYYYGQYEGTSTKIWLIRKWARDCWKENPRIYNPKQSNQETSSHG